MIWPCSACHLSWRWADHSALSFSVFRSLSFCHLPQNCFSRDSHVLTWPPVWGAPLQWNPLTRCITMNLGPPCIIFIPLRTLANFSVSCTLQKSSLVKYSQLNITHFVGFCSWQILSVPKELVSGIWEQGKKPMSLCSRWNPRLFRLRPIPKTIPWI